MGYYLVMKMNKVLMHATTWNELWKNYIKWKKLVTKDHIVYDSIDMECPEDANL